MSKKEKKSSMFFLGICLVGMVALLVIVGLFYTPYDPNKMNSSVRSAAPSLTHLFGTDNFGRDILSRVMEGTKTTFFVALLTVLIGAGCGTIIGALTGYYGGWFDEIIMRMNDGLNAFPSVLLALVFVSIFGGGTVQLVLVLGVVFIPSFARIVRSEFLTLKNMDFVKNAKLCGAGDMRIIFVHLLPNTKRILLSAITIGFNNAVLAEAGMSFLSLGVQPPNASLGRMLSEAQSYLFTAPWYAIFPGLIIVILVLGISFISESL